jgi:hypothetical protein
MIHKDRDRITQCETLQRRVFKNREDTIAEEEEAGAAAAQSSLLIEGLKTV